MRLKTEIWVQAYLRTLDAKGVAAVLVRRGDNDAGAVFIKVARLDGRAALFGPAPAGHADAGLGRAFACLHDGETVPEADADRRISEERRFDPDIWIVEVEDRLGRHHLDDWLQKGSQ
jgi:hypothetical protein